MKLSDARENHYFFSGQASEIIRKLGLAGVAVVWIFKEDASNGRVRLPELLLEAGLLVILGLTVDLLQYAVGAALWRWFMRKKEKELFAKRSELSNAEPPNNSFNPEEEHFWAPAWMPLPMVVMFWLKIVLILGAYLLITVFLIRRLNA